MESVGTTIKLARENRKLTLSQVADATRISYRHLQSIEEGRVRDLPGGMYNRAFVRAYAEHLGLDSRAILEKFSAEAPPAEKPGKHKIAVTQPSAPSRGHPVLAWSVMLVISVTGIFLSRHWIAEVFSPYFQRSRPELSPVVAPVPTATAPAAQQQAAAPPRETVPATVETPAPAISHEPAAAPASVEPSPKPAPSAATAAAAAPATEAATQPPLQPAPSAGKLRVRLDATDNCWTSVTSDSTRVLSAELKPGDQHEFVAERMFTIVLGNAGGVSLSINGIPAKPLGKTGEVVKAVITEQNLADFLPTQNP